MVPFVPREVDKMTKIKYRLLEVDKMKNMDLKLEAILSISLPFAAKPFLLVKNASELHFFFIGKALYVVSVLTFVREWHWHCPRCL